MGGDGRREDQDRLRQDSVAHRFRLQVGSGRGNATRGERTSADKAKRITDEHAKISGVRQVVSAESDGEKAPEERVKMIRVTISGHTQTVRFGEQVVAHDVRFDLDPFSDPKAVPDTITDGPDKGKTIEGIYRLDGDDLTTCTAPVGKRRPRVFESGKETGHTLRRFQRVKT